MACGTKKPKPKTKAPTKTRTLESFAKHKVSLSKSTEDKLRTVYNLRKRAKVYERRTKKYRQQEEAAKSIKAKKAPSKKVPGPSLSKSTEDRLKASYTKRKTAKRSVKNLAKTEKKPSSAPKKNAVNMRGKEKQIERWLKGSDMWNMPHGIKASLASDGRPTLYRAPIGGSMTTTEVIEVIRSSRKHPWISDIKSDVHGDIVDRDFAVRVLKKKL